MSKDINKLHQFLHQESVLTLSTHDAEGVTDKDFELAKMIDELVS